MTSETELLQIAISHLKEDVEELQTDHQWCETMNEIIENNYIPIPKIDLNKPVNMQINALDLFNDTSTNARTYSNQNDYIKSGFNHRLIYQNKLYLNNINTKHYLILLLFDSIDDVYYIRPALIYHKEGIEQDFKLFKDTNKNDETILLERTDVNYKTYKGYFIIPLSDFKYDDDGNDLITKKINTNTSQKMLERIRFEIAFYSDNNILLFKFRTRLMDAFHYNGATATKKNIDSNDNAKELKDLNVVESDKGYIVFTCFYNYIHKKMIK